MNLLVFFVLCASLKFGLAATNGIYVYNENDCMCPGQNITYECSVIGGLFTVWNGSITAGDCTIILIHSDFEAGTAHGFCDTGSNTATARGVRVENNNCYISQLTVLATPDLDGRTIECCIDYGPMNVTHIGTETLTLTRVPFLPPSNLQLIDVTPSELTFTWTPPPQQCLSLTFNITSESCGTCESVSTQPTTTCSNFTRGTVCIIKVYSVICGNIVSLSPSRVISATLEVPEAPSIITCVPHYSETNGRLLSIETNFNAVEPFLISDGVDGSAINYTLSYTNNLGAVCSLGTVLPTSCDENVCTHVFEASTVSPFCSQISESGIFISVYATNKLGNGHANRIFKDGVNRLVKVLFNSSTLNFNCTFLNESLDREKECQANLSYGDNCENDQGVYIGSINQGNTLITNAIEPLDDTTKYCYTVRARSGNKTVVVNGTFTLGLVISDSGITNGIIAAIVVLSILIIIIITGALMLLIFLIIKYRRGANRQVITRFSCIQKIDDLLEVLKVFKDHNINIIGFNAYCEPQQQHRKEAHLHLRLKRQDKEALERILTSSSPTFLDNDVLSTGEHIYTTAIVSLKDKLGALWTSLKTIQDHSNEIELKLEGVNTWSTETTSDGYKDIFVSCLCPQRIHMQNISDKLKDAGARNTSYEFSAATESRVFIFIRDKFSMLIHALKIFGDLNISVVGLGKDYSEHQKVEDRKYFVECKMENQTTSEDENQYSRKLESFGAKDCTASNSDGSDTVMFEFTVRDEIGSLASVLQGFVTLGMEIISINHNRRDQESATDDKEYRHILITCDSSFRQFKIEEKKFCEDLEATGYVDNPTIETITDSQAKLEFDIRHVPGALVAALKVLAKYDINMTKIDNLEDNLIRQYRKHLVQFISTESQERQLISKLEEIGSEPRLERIIKDNQELQETEV